MTSDYDAIIVGSGPNGLSAAITLAERGISVLVLEAHEHIGGGTRSAELTLPGFTHDVCSAIHPMAALSPAFRRMALGTRGVTWIEPPAALAHPLDDGRAALLWHSLDETALGLDTDADSYRTLLASWVARAPTLFSELLGPLRVPRHPFLLAGFGWTAMKSAERLARHCFKTVPARALFAGCAAHSFLPFDAPASSAIGLTLLLAAHVVGWPIAKGGSTSISGALADCLTSLGGVIETRRRVTSWGDIPKSRVVMFDTSPKTMARICRDRLPASYLRRLAHFRPAPSIFKLDWALDGPIPWKNKQCGQAATVHLGGTFEEIAYSESEVNRGIHPQRPYVLVAQQSLFDPTRAPPGKHTGWSYCHVPTGSTVDMTEAIERQIERFAPGFRDCILARHTMTTAELSQYNENYEGGDITGGANDIRQVLMRPTLGWTSYQTPVPGIYLCSSSTPPGGGVHGMCGYHAASLALRQVFGRTKARIAGPRTPS
jgi:Phytoene dehydrogenase and related proteins